MEYAGKVRSRFRRRVLSEPPQFGPWLTDYGVKLWLWAPAGTCLTARSWFVLHRDDANAGARYAFKIDGDLTIPDPGSHFQPEDVHGPSEFIDHRYIWRCRQWRGLVASGYFLRAARGHVTERGTFVRQSGNSITGHYSD